MEVGAHVWVSQPTGTEAWTLAKIVSRSAEEIRLCQSSDPSNHIIRPALTSSSSPTSTSTPHTKGDELQEFQYDGVELEVKLTDSERLAGADDDVANLVHLHEPSILQTICERFENGKIYTWAGSTLLAMNPFQTLPLYSMDFINAGNRSRTFQLNRMPIGDKRPHIFAIADRSYRQMMTSERKSQSILISGESGAGKTESAKFIMSYITQIGTVSGGRNDTEDCSTSKSPATMEKILQSNPILEAFGNAQTIRNKNSSRFGKFIELGFNESGEIIGTKIQTFLLEKVRVSHQCLGERNYHIFYQLLRDIDDKARQGLPFHRLESTQTKVVDDYHYTNQGGAHDGWSEMPGRNRLNDTATAMRTLGWDNEKIDKVFAIVEGLLYLGQVNFHCVQDYDGQDVAGIEDDAIMLHAARLLGAKGQYLKAALTERKLVTCGETITMRISPTKATEARDILARTIYGALFSWIVAEVNRSTAWENESDATSSICVLDIFGFECFPTNSFEQLCINFANETLQQQFNTFTFKEKLLEYNREGISCDFISFHDNQRCIDEIGGKFGIWQLIDDESRLGSRGSDSNWVRCLYKKLDGQQGSMNKSVFATPIQRSQGLFRVKHFAGDVDYTAKGFLEKNKDEVGVATKGLFETADSWLLKNMYQLEMLPNAESNAPKTVGRLFKRQLNSLMSTINRMEPHYVRCLKPNDSAKPNLLIRRRIVEQLRSGGVIESVRVARMGYPIRFSHEMFLEDYRLLASSTLTLDCILDENDLRLQCERLHDEIFQVVDSNERIPLIKSRFERQNRPSPSSNITKHDIQVGRSKVFMTKAAYECLEGETLHIKTKSAVVVQSLVRGRQQRQRLHHDIIRDAIKVVQRVYRGYIVRKRLRIVKRGMLLLQKVTRNVMRKRVSAGPFATGPSCKSDLTPLDDTLGVVTFRKVGLHTSNDSFRMLTLPNANEQMLARRRRLLCWIPVLSLSWLLIVCSIIVILNDRCTIASQRLEEIHQSSISMMLFIMIS